MCTLAVLRDVCARYPLVIAANRDEFYVRPASSPRLLDDVPGVVAGRDLQAGGTWLGCRVKGGMLVAGLLNRRAPGESGRSSTGELSRGSLCLDALRQATLEVALRTVTTMPLDRYGPFNLLLADLRRAVVVQNSREPVTTELAGGLSLLTNLDVNDPRCPRLASAVPAFRSLADRIRDDLPTATLVDQCRSVLASHENSLDPSDGSPLSRLCVHTEVYGTRSASVIFVTAEGRVRYFHAPGPPCEALMTEVEIEAPAVQ